MKAVCGVDALAFLQRRTLRRARAHHRAPNIHEGGGRKLCAAPLGRAITRRGGKCGQRDGDRVWSEGPSVCVTFHGDGVVGRVFFQRRWG